MRNIFRPFCFSEACYPVLGTRWLSSGSVHVHLICVGRERSEVCTHPTLLDSADLREFLGFLYRFTKMANAERRRQPFSSGLDAGLLSWQHSTTWGKSQLTIRPPSERQFLGEWKNLTKGLLGRGYPPLFFCRVCLMIFAERTQRGVSGLRARPGCLKLVVRLVTYGHQAHCTSPASSSRPFHCSWSRGGRWSGEQTQ